MIFSDAQIPVWVSISALSIDIVHNLLPIFTKFCTSLGNLIGLVFLTPTGSRR